MLKHGNEKELANRKFKENYLSVLKNTSLNVEEAGATSLNAEKVEDLLRNEEVGGALAAINGDINSIINGWYQDLTISLQQSMAAHYKLLKENKDVVFQKTLGNFSEKLSEEESEYISRLNNFDIESLNLFKEDDFNDEERKYLSELEAAERGHNLDPCITLSSLPSLNDEIPASSYPNVSFSGNLNLGDPLISNKSANTNFQQQIWENAANHGIPFEIPDGSNVKLDTSKTTRISGNSQYSAENPIKNERIPENLNRRDSSQRFSNNGVSRILSASLCEEEFEYRHENGVYGKYPKNKLKNL